MSQLCYNPCQNIDVMYVLLCHSTVFTGTAMNRGKLPKSRNGTPLRMHWLSLDTALRHRHHRHHLNPLPLLLQEQK